MLTASAVSCRNGRLIGPWQVLLVVFRRRQNLNQLGSVGDQPLQGMAIDVSRHAWAPSSETVPRGRFRHRAAAKIDSVLR